MNLAEFAGRFSEVRWSPARDEFTVPCLRHPQSMARATVAHGRINLKSACVCSPDQIIASSNGSPENSANGIPPRTPPRAAIAPPAEVGAYQTPPLHVSSPPFDDILRRKPPQDLEAEQSVLGAIFLVENQSIKKILEILAPTDFYRETHQDIYRAMLSLAQDDVPIDAITMTNALRTRGKLEAIGGPAYIAELAACVPTTANIAYYARIVRDKAVLREVASAAIEITNTAYDNPADVPGFLALVEKRLTAPATSLVNGGGTVPARKRAPGLHTVSDYMAEMESRQERKALIRGLIHEGETVLMVGRAMAGKSTAACAMAHCFSTGGDFLGRVVRKTRIGYLALERNGHDVARKFTDWGISDDVLFTDEVPPMQPAALAEFLARQITEHHLGVLFVDHLQNLVRVADSNDYAVVSNALEPFAAVARRTGCALILLHHLPKSPREDGEIDAMGSEAYRGAADCFIESTRSNGRYFIRAEARGGGLLPRMVLTLDRETGIVSGINALDAERVELEGRILEHLNAVGEPVPGPELREALGTRSKILFEALENLVETKKVDRSGEGKKKHPHIYQISTFRHSASTGNANVESAGDRRTTGADDGRVDSTFRHYPTVGKANVESENVQSALRPQAKILFPRSEDSIAKNGAAEDSFQPLTGTANDANDESVKVGRAAMAPDANEEIEL